MLIISRGITEESIGRITAVIDSQRKVVRFRTKDGHGLERSELELMTKYLRYHHPEIVNKAGIQTGWAIQGEIEITEPVAPPARAPRPTVPLKQAIKAGLRRGR